MTTATKTEPAAPAAAPLPAAPKRYRVLKNFVTSNGTHWLKSAEVLPPVQPEPPGLISLSDEEAEAALKDGAVEEYHAAGTPPRVPNK